MLAIIGTSGRKDPLIKKDFINMYNHAKKFVKKHHIKHVVSGGAAWADHVAVKLFLRNKINFLTLELPCSFENKFKDTGVVNWITNPGGTLNYYHRKFTQIRNRDSLAEINQAIQKGAECIIHSSLHERNRYVASSATMMLAYGITPELVDGGTKYTWDRCVLSKDKKTYINIRCIHNQKIDD